MVPEKSAGKSGKGGKSAKPRQKDTRTPDTIWGERFNTEARLMEQRFRNLRRLANARNAVPTEEQIAAAEKYLTENVQSVLRSFRESLQPTNGAGSTEAGPFQVVPGAPAKVYAKPPAAKGS